LTGNKGRNMIKSSLLAGLSFFLLIASSSAQTAEGKALVIINDFSDSGVFVIGLARAAQMKQAGLDVSLLFEDSAVLCFLDLHGELSKPGWTQKVRALSDELAGPEAKKYKIWPRRFQLLETPLVLSEMRRSALRRVMELNIPYIVSSESAKSYFVYDELKAAGEPLSPDPKHTVDISNYIKQGYRIIVY